MMLKLLQYNLIVFVSFFIGPAHAGLLGPSNYDECITESMKGVTSDIAARALILSCRERFPVRDKKKPASRPLTNMELSNLTGRAGLEYANVYKGNIYNGNQNVTLSEVTLSITTTQKGKEVTRQYLDDVDIPPLKTGLISFNIIVGDTKAEYSWGIVGAKGY